jgi:hypothetical protein
MRGLHLGRRLGHPVGGIVLFGAMVCFLEVIDLSLESGVTANGLVKLDLGLHELFLQEQHFILQVPVRSLLR